MKFAKKKKGGADGVVTHIWYREARARVTERPRHGVSERAA